MKSYERLRGSWNKKRPAEVMKMGFTRSGNNEREEWGERERETLDGLYFSLFFEKETSSPLLPFFLRVEAVTLLLNSSASQQENEWSLWQQTFTWRGHIKRHGMYVSTDLIKANIQMSDWSCRMTCLLCLLMPRLMVLHCSSQEECLCQAIFSFYLWNTQV